MMFGCFLMFDIFEAKLQQWSTGVLVSRSRPGAQNGHEASLSWAMVCILKGFESQRYDHFYRLAATVNWQWAGRALEP